MLRLINWPNNGLRLPSVGITSLLLLLLECVILALQIFAIKLTFRCLAYCCSAIDVLVPGLEDPGKSRRTLPLIWADWPMVMTWFCWIRFIRMLRACNNSEAV